MPTYTVIRRGKPIKNSSGKVVGFKKGKSTTVTTDSSKRTVITGSGKQVSKTTRKEVDGKIVLEGKSREQINLEARQPTTPPPTSPIPEEQKAQQSFARVEDLERGRRQSFARTEDLERGRISTPVPEAMLRRERVKEESRIKSEEIKRQMGGLDKPVSILDKEFFTKEGQLQRLEATKRIYRSFGPGGNEGLPVVNRKIVSNKFTADVLEVAARNPFETAFVATGVTGIIKAGISITGSVAAKIAGKEVAKQSITKTAALTSRLPFGIAAAESVVRTSQGVSALKNKEVFFDKNFKSALGATFERQGYGDFTGVTIAERVPFIGGKRVPGTGGLRRAAFEVTPAAGDKVVFRNLLREELQARGFSGERLESAVSAGSNFRTSTIVGEAGGQLFLGATTERLGRVLVGDIGKRIAQKNLVGRPAFRAAFKSQGTRTLIPGAVEGVEAVRIQDVSRVSPQQRSLTENVAFGVVGAASAGVLGGIIGARTTTGVGSRVGGTTKKPRVVNIAANIADPFEKPGDILADLRGFAGKGFRGSPKSVITVPLGVSSISSTLQRNTISSRPFSPVNVRNNLFVPSDVPVQVGVPSDVPVSVQPRSPVSIRNNLFVPSDVFTQTEVPSQVTSKTSVTVPTGGGLLFPVVPLGGGGGRGFRGDGFSVPRKPRSAAPPSLIGAFFGVGKKTSKGGEFSGLGVRQ